MDDHTSEVTRLLRQWSAGDAEALDKIIPMVFDEVRRLARKALSAESVEHTLEPTALVHEAYLRLIGRETYWWRDRVQFFSSLAELMRRILVDHARRQGALKRGGDIIQVPLDEGILASKTKPAALVALDDVLDDLKEVDERRYRIVMLWFFVGLTQEEIGRELGISVNTVARQWESARVWLQHEMQDHGRLGGG